MRYKGVTISDFNADTFNAYLRNDSATPGLDIAGTEFGQVIQTLLDENHSAWQHQPDFAVVWTRPEGVIESFNRVLDFEQISNESLLSEVDQYTDLLIGMSKRVDYVFVPTWVVPHYYRGWGLLDMQIGIRHSLMHMNARLMENLKGANNIYLLDAERWLVTAGKQAFNPKLWYMAKVAYGNPVFKEAVRDIKAAFTAIGGGAKKLIVLDLDDVLWGGVVGDDGWENLVLGGHSAVGESFVHFQKTLKSLTKRGILLGIVSKNTESVALEAITKHPEMVLRLDSFVGWRINWQDKAQNVADLVAELNLGLQSVVFIDDNPIERARVREALPEVFVPEWTQDKLLYQQSLLELTCFDSTKLSQEDSERTQMYLTERKRSQLKNSVGSIEDWLESLEIQVDIQPLDEANLARTVQLLNKTNQMNLTTRRLSEKELLAWVGEPHNMLWTFRVKDKFGDQGLTGIASIELNNGKAYVTDYILSCRVMGRKIEETLVATLVEYARKYKADEVIALYKPTAKNQPCLDFWKQSGFTYHEKDNRFTWDTAKAYAFPSQITVTTKESAINHKTLA